MLRSVLLSSLVATAVVVCALPTVRAAEDAPAATPAADVANSTQPVVDAATEKNWALLNNYCSDCHNFTDWAGGVAFDTMTPESIPTETKVWENAVRKLRGRLMPPPGKKQPDQSTVDSFVSWMESRLDETATAHPNPGHVALHRLNRTEYANAIEDLLALRVDASTLLPKDVDSDGFDNVAQVLKVSPSFLDQYIAAARDLSVRAVGDHAPLMDATSYRATGDQTFYREGMPLGTRGGVRAEHYFPSDGEYSFEIKLPEQFDVNKFGIEFKHKVVMTIDGVQVFENTIGGDEDLRAFDKALGATMAALQARFKNIRLHVKAGAHEVAVAFVARTFAESDDTLQPLDTALGGFDKVARIIGLDIAGPYQTTGVGETESRKRIFVCHPNGASEESPCAMQIVSKLAGEAFRRPVTQADLEAPLRFYSAGRQLRDFDYGIQQAVMAILASPKFLYRAIQVPQNVVPGQPFRITDLELASRLSFFLWSRGPDEELLELAAANKLREPGVLEQQVKRMFADPRSRSLITNFAFQWLNVDKIDDIDPDPTLFPDFDANLRASFRREMELFLDSILRTDRPVTDLLTADHTFVNERLAIHYGMPNIRGDQFRRVIVDSKRYGLLGKGAVLMGTSYANRTSPVLRGAWILENITGTPPAAPPPGVEALKETVAGAKVQTVRERLEEHRKNPSCNACHGIMDPLGFALENFDAVGKWRERDRDALTVIDAGGQLPDGTVLGGPQELRAALMQRPGQFVQAFTEKLMIFALGRGIEHQDMPTIRALVRDAKRDDYRFSALLLALVKSDPFQMSVIEPEGEGTTTTAQASK